MRTTVRFLLLTITLFGLTACWDVEPGDVTDNGAAQPMITATFALRSSVFGKPADTGGGCLVYQTLVRAQKKCLVDADCTIFPPGSSTTSDGKPTLDGKVPTPIPGYCAGDIEPQPIAITFSKGMPVRTCWHQPSTQSCLRKPSPDDPLQESVGPYQLPAIKAYPSGAKRPVRWRVITCQNLEIGGCGKTGAINGKEKLYRYGNIKTYN